ncbi:hypothetical protein D4764_12G0009350 [Takifugu flavidus]|uniref:Uncharacterized protein n=1 Tax=Takifugu flavidus TaxID=433684 RepID=A0A5C6PDN9_9TELE|nr:hypothetical protein D4764_12G0009350 [Takifugu flavidus]
MKISTSKSEAMVLNRKKVECLLRVKEEQEIDRRIGIRSNADSAPVRCGEERAEPKGLNLPVDLRSYPHLWVAGLSLRDRVRSSAIREELGVEPLLLRVERSQMRWLGHLVRMPLDASLVRCSGHVPPVGDPREDPGHVGETMSLEWSGNAWGSFRMSWKK